MSGALAAAGEGAAVGGLMGAAGGALGGGRAGARSEEAEGAGEAEAGAEEDSAGASCPIHSFTAETPVLLADGTSKPISQIKVGDQITNAVPGDDHTQVHTVERVIVTTTDHDFVDVTVKADHSAGGVNTGAKTGLQTKARTWTGKLRAAVAAVALAAVTVTSTATPAAAATPQASPVADPVTVSASTAAGSTLTTTFHHPFFDITQAAFTEADNLHTGDRLQTTDGGTATITNLRLYHQTTTTYDLTIGGLHTYYVLAGPTPLLVHNCGNQTFSTRSEAKAAAYARAGLAPDATPDATWTVGDDVTQRGMPGYRFDTNPTAHGNYEQFETENGSRVVAEHTNDPNQPGPHFHAGQPKSQPSQNGVNFGWDISAPFERYRKVGGDHHLYYPSN